MYVLSALRARALMSATPRTVLGEPNGAVAARAKALVIFASHVNTGDIRVPFKLTERAGIRKTIRRATKHYRLQLNHTVLACEVP